MLNNQLLCVWLESQHQILGAVVRVIASFLVLRDSRPSSMRYKRPQSEC